MEVIPMGFFTKLFQSPPARPSGGPPIDVSPVRAPGELEWASSRDLAAAIREEALDGLRFALRDIARDGCDETLEPDLTLTFSALATIPAEKRHRAGLALRCIVGLTAPVVAATTPVVRAFLVGDRYTVALGPGVPLPLFMATATGAPGLPLKTTSEERDDDIGETEYRVSIICPMFCLGGPPGASASHERVLDLIAQGFERLRPRTVVLA
jgi:hypothetical protein